MNLLHDMKVPCVMLDKSRVPDGEGGWRTTWKESFPFDAVINFNTSLEARQAEQSGVKSLYTVTVDKSIKLEYHDVFKRLWDGKVFRVTSDGDDQQTPDFSSIHASAWVTAEEYNLAT